MRGTTSQSKVVGESDGGGAQSATAVVGVLFENWSQQNKRLWEVDGAHGSL